MNFNIFIIFCICYSITTAQYTEDDARSYVAEVNDKLFSYYDEINALKFVKDQDHNKFISRRQQELASNISEITRKAQKFKITEFQDEELKSAIYNIKRSSFLYILGAEYFTQLLPITLAIKSINAINNICEYEYPSNCEMSYIPDVRRIISHFNGKPEELKHYWIEWRNKHALAAKGVFKVYLKSIREAINLTDVSPLGFWYQAYGGESTLLDEMEKVIIEIKPFYQLIHAFVRYELNIIYGDGVVSERGPIPHHLLEMVLMQAWKKDGVLEQSYPHKKLPNLKFAMDEHGLKGIQNIINSADQFYKSLGLNPLPSQIREENFVRSTQTDGPECKAHIYDDTPNIRVEYCPQSNFKKFLQMHGWMGRIYYANQKKNLPFAFYKSYNLEEAFGEACILSASTPKHIQNIGILPNYQYTPQHLLNRLFRMGIHTWFNIPIYFVHAKVMNDLLAAKVKLNNLNEYYWKQMEEYVGVEPPVDRTKESFDFPYKFYEGMEHNHQTSKFMSEIMGYQIYKTICEQSGQYSKTNPMDHPLHNCDFYGFSEIGKNLTNMMELGSKESWREVLSKITNDESGLNGRTLLKYYEPLEVWLKENIKINRIFVGWEPSRRVLNKELGANENKTMMDAFFRHTNDSVVLAQILNLP